MVRYRAAAFGRSTGYTLRYDYDDAPQRLLTRYGRQTLEEVFLDVARGRGEAREAAQ